MYNDFRKHKKSDSVKWIVAFSLIIVLLAGMVSNFLFDFGIVEPKEEEKTNESDKTIPDGSDTGTEEENEQTSFIPTEVHETSGVKLMSAPMLTAEGDEGVSISATVSSSTGTEYFDKTLTWTLGFKNAASTWAKGKNVNDYITINIAEDTQSVTVICKKAFGEPVIVKAVSYDNPEINATCQLDYVKRINDVSILGVNYDTEDSDPDLTYQDAVKFGANEVDYRFAYGVGTLTPSVSVSKVKINVGDKVASEIKARLPDSTQSWAFEVTPRSNSTDSNTGSATFDVSIGTFYIKDYEPGTGDTTALNNAFYYTLYNCSEGRNHGIGLLTSDIKLTFSFDVKYGGKTFQTASVIGDGCHDPVFSAEHTYMLVSDGLSLISSVSDITFNKNGIIF